MDGLENLLSSVMNDEELMNKIKNTVKNQSVDASSISEVISLITPNIKSTENNSNLSKEAENEIVTDSSEKTEVKNNTLSFVNSISHSVSKNSGLLLALKPYLSKERCQIIDGIVKLSQIADTLNLL